MQEWNAVISVRERSYRHAFEVFAEFGRVKGTEFYNVLLLHAENVPVMLETLRDRSHSSPHTLAFLARLIPVSEAFIFNSAIEFRDQARATILGWAPRLLGRSFFVRIHRRGFKGRISSVDEEQAFDTAVLAALEACGRPGRIDFKDPDAVIVIETVGHWAGLALFTREDREGYSFIRVE